MLKGKEVDDWMMGCEMAGESTGISDNTGTGISSFGHLSGFSGSNGFNFGFQAFSGIGSGSSMNGGNITNNTNTNTNNT